MPIDYKTYPPDWAEISRSVRFVRAGNRCECAGECGRVHTGGRCPAKQLDDLPSGWRVYLTTAHLWRGPCAECYGAGVKCGEPGHLKAMCQSCHLNYDRPHHLAAFKNTIRLRRVERETARGLLFDAFGETKMENLKVFQIDTETVAAESESDACEFVAQQFGYEDFADYLGDYEDAAPVLIPESEWDKPYITAEDAPPDAGPTMTLRQAMQERIGGGGRFPACLCSTEY